MRAKRLAGIGLLLIVIVLVAFGCASSKAPAAKGPPGYEKMMMLGSSIGSTGTVVVTVYGKILNKYYPEINWSSCSGVIGPNTAQLVDGTAKLGMASTSMFVSNYGWSKVPGSRLRGISQPLPLLNWVFLIPQDKPWKDITEVPKGTNLSPGTPGGAPPVLCEVWLKLCGLSKDYFNWRPMGKTEMVDAWRAGSIDIAFSDVQGMAPWLQDMGISPRKPKAMGLSPQQAAKAKAEKTFEQAGFYAPETSNVVELAPGVFKDDVVCPKGPYTFACRDDFPEEISYRMAKIFDEHHEELVQSFPEFKYGTAQFHIKYAGPPYDIHAGVARYYKEKGYLK